VLDRLSGISFSNSEKQENQLIAVFCVWHHLVLVAGYQHSSRTFVTTYKSTWHHRTEHQSLSSLTSEPKISGLWRCWTVKMSNFLGTIHRLSLIKNTTFRRLESVSVIRKNLLRWAQLIELLRVYQLGPKV
jgi:hypothetical protein